MNRKLIAQGDILIVPVDNIPAGLKDLERKDGAIILAEGEVTGHFHAIKDAETSAFVDEKDSIWLEVKNLIAEVIHNEHDTVKLAPGKYQVVRQREYVAPIINPRQVAD